MESASDVTDSAPKSLNLQSVNSGLQSRFSIVNVPWNRRMQVQIVMSVLIERKMTLRTVMQTLTVACFVAALPLTAFCSIASMFLLLVPFINLFMVAYYTYIFFIDQSPYNGSRSSLWFRSLRWWTHFKDFFPIRLIKTADLSPDEKYIFGYHPHGIISFGALSCFGTEACGFSSLFPGIRVNLVTLAINLHVPFLREIWLSLGVCSADKKTFRAILSQGPGRAIAVVVGGAAESLKAAPGTLDLHLAKRKGFVRQAILHQASLVPVLAFGETDVYGVMRWSWMEALQERMQKLMGFALPFFHGRGVFNYDFGLLPYRKPLTVVIGAPVPVPKTDNKGNTIAEHGEKWLLRNEEGIKLVDDCHQAYVEAIQSLYHQHKGVFFVERVQSMRIE